MKAIKRLLIIQARINSKRLPNKIFLKIKGKYVIERVVERVKKIPNIDNFLIATSTLKEDDRIVEWCKKKKYLYFRGSHTNLLDRFYQAAKKYKAEKVVRITSDCPLLDPYVCSQVITLQETTNSDYVCNNHPYSWPDGLDCEVIKFKTLKKTWEKAKLPSEKEHVTRWIRANRENFKIKNLFCPFPGVSSFRWTIDNKEDYFFLKKLINSVNNESLENFIISTKKILNNKINNKNIRNEGLEISRLQDQETNEFKQRSYKKSLFLLKKAQKIIPLGSQTFSKSYINWPKGNSPLFLTHGLGSRVWDVDGNEYVDLVGSLLPIILGYCDPDINYAIINQLQKGISFSLSNKLEFLLSKKLTEIIPCAEQVRLAKTGSEVTSAAIRLARAYTKKDKIICCGYHGWHDWFIGTTSMNKGVPKNIQKNVHNVNFKNIEQIDKLFLKYKNQFAAIIIEPVLKNKFDKQKLQNIKALARSHKALLIFDEVKTGFRIALGGAQEYYGVLPDLACFGKSMGNGMPIAALVGSKKIMSKLEDIFFSSTFGGETLSIISALKVIEKIQKEKVIKKLWNYGEKLSKEVIKKIQKYNLDKIITISGLGPWKTLDFNNTKNINTYDFLTLFKKNMCSNGVLVSTSHNISYSHNQEDFETILNAYEETFIFLVNLLNDKKLSSKFLKIPKVKPIFK